MISTLKMKLMCIRTTAIMIMQKPSMFIRTIAITIMIMKHQRVRRPLFWIKTDVRVPLSWASGLNKIQLNHETNMFAN